MLVKNPQRLSSYQNKTSQASTMSATRHGYSPIAFLYLPADLLEALDGDHLHWNTLLPPEVDNRKMLALKGILLIYQALSCATA